MANMYRSVLAGGGGVQPTGDAVAADVLTGKTFSNASAIGISGTMPNNGAVSQTIQPGSSYNIPAGYHNGNGVITAGSSAPDYEISISGTSTSTLGTDFTVGKHYQIVIIANNIPTGFSGGTLNKQKNITGGIFVDLTATAATITATGGSQYTGTTVISEY